MRLEEGVLRILTGECAGDEYHFEDGEILTIGRDPQSDILLPDSYKHVSRKHCSVAYDGIRHRFFITDTSSGGIYNESWQRFRMQGFIPESCKMYFPNEECTIEFFNIDEDGKRIPAKKSNAAKEQKEPVKPAKKQAVSDEDQQEPKSNVKKAAGKKAEKSKADKPAKEESNKTTDGVKADEGKKKPL